jgi:hypothetical protein
MKRTQKLLCTGLFSKKLNGPPLTGQQPRIQVAKIERLRSALEAIKKAAIEGRVCDDVAWFDTITILHDQPNSPNTST